MTRQTKGEDGNLLAMGACSQCKAPMMLAEIYVLGPVCGKCCKANHRRVTTSGMRRELP